jgi:hypothetical protein
MKIRIIITGWMCMIAILSQAQIRVLNIADNQALANSPAFVDASSNVTANNNQSWGKGLVFPRVDLSTFTLPAITGGYGKANSFPTYLDGMIVYNTNTGGTAGVGSTDGTLTPGYWYYENKSGTETGGTWKALGSGSPDAPQLAGSASIILDGDSLVRAELTGDVTAAVNSNVTKISSGAIRSEHIGYGAVGAVHMSAMGAAAGDALVYDGSGWIASPVNPTSVSTTMKFLYCESGGASCSINPGEDWMCGVVSSNGSSGGTPGTGTGTGNTCTCNVANCRCTFLCVR